MRIWIIRHGKALPGSASGRDEDRELAPRGMEQARWLGAALSDPTRAPVRVLTSPLPRALATARLVADAVGGGAVVTGKCPLAVREQLSTAHGLDEHLELLRAEIGPAPAVVPELAEGESLAAESAGATVAIVGHNPTLTELARWLLGVSTGAELRTGEALLLGRSPGAGEPWGRGTMELRGSLRLAGE